MTSAATALPCARIPLITVADLQAVIATAASAESSPLILDCSFDLADTDAGQRAFDTLRVPGARYVHLDRDLCRAPSPQGPVDGGRHPLPDLATFAATAARWGVTAGRLVVCYDRQGGPYAARAWWMLRWIGHGEVAVLDGGLAAWQAAGAPVENGLAAVVNPPVAASTPSLSEMQGRMPTVSAAQLLSTLGQRIVIDARAAERFRGDVEPLDRRAGHIPGARNRFFKDNLATDGRFLPPEVLRAAFADWAAAPQPVIHQCGSGVTACHNLLAMEIAGLHGSALYPGSWSEWSADPTRPIALG